MPQDITTRPVADTDLAAIGALHAAVFGPGRFARTAYRVREGKGQSSVYCRVAVQGERIIAALRMTPIRIGAKPSAVLLGPLAVDTEFANQGHGRRLIAECMAQAQAAGERLVVLVGDESYYGRLGFRAVPPGRFGFPGPADPERILAHELVVGSLEDYQGRVGGA